MSDAVAAPVRQPVGKTLGQLWGMLFLMALFATGAWRLLGKGFGLLPEALLTNLDYFVFGALVVFGAAKAEFLFRRTFIPRTLARAREALGETGWSGDYWLAPFCMLSFYRPWQRKHQIMSLLLIPLMVGLAVFFVIGPVPDSIKAAVDVGIGLALLFAALHYLYALLLTLVWWLGGAAEESHPLPRWIGPKPLLAEKG